MASKEYKTLFFKVIHLHSVHLPLPPPRLLFLLGSQVSFQIFKKGGLTRSQFLEGACWKRGSDFFEQGEGGIAVFT